MAMEVELDGQKYVFTGTDWYDAKTYLRPPKIVIDQLNQRLEPELDIADASVTDPYRLTELASQARMAGQQTRAEGLARRALELKPDHAAAAAVLSASLRSRGAAREAVNVTEPFKRGNDPVLLTTRAAAQCDVGHWQEAKSTIARALAIKNSEEALSVMRRIKRAHPELYDSS